MRNEAKDNRDINDFHNPTAALRQRVVSPVATALDLPLIELPQSVYVAADVLLLATWRL